MLGVSDIAVICTKVRGRNRCARSHVLIGDPGKKTYAKICVCFLLGNAEHADMNRRRFTATATAAATLVPSVGYAAGAGWSMPQASHFVALALRGIAQEFPNKMDHVMQDAAGVKRPRELHPAFYGCFDWHSSVHGHWMLVHLLKRYPELPEAAAVRTALGANLAEANLAGEITYLKQPGTGSFEYPAAWEPGGEDFLPPALMEADLMRRVLAPGEFLTWWAKFLPEVPPALLTPAVVADRTDPKIVHLDGLNLSRAACLWSISGVFPQGAPQRKILAEAAERHAAASLPHVASGDYAGEHWLASFAVWMLSAKP